MKKRILIIVTNVNAYANKNLKTGLWLGELTHFFTKTSFSEIEGFGILMYSRTSGVPNGLVTPPTKTNL
jgi:hypothetical protein